MMTLGWNTEGDFNDVVDTLESVELHRQGCPDNSDTLQGWRFRETIDTDDSVNSGVRLVDLTWQLPVHDLPDPPSPGDVVVDEAGLGSTIRAVIQLRGSSRYTCSARRAELHPATAERFDIDRPIYLTTSEGPVIDRWEKIRVAVEGHFAPIPTSQSDKFRLSIVCGIAVEIGDRVHRHRGGVFRVEAIEVPEAVGDPSVFTIIDEATYAAEAA